MYWFVVLRRAHVAWRALMNVSAGPYRSSCCRSSVVEGSTSMRGESLRTIAAPFVAVGPSGVAIRTRLGHLSAEDEEVLRLVGAHLGSLASKGLKRRCADGLEHSAERWAERKRDLTEESSSRWAGSITKATHDQWALARRAQLAHIQSLQAGVRTIAHRLSLPIGERGKGAGGRAATAAHKSGSPSPGACRSLKTGCVPSGPTAPWAASAS